MCIVVGMQFNENVLPLPCTCSHTGNATLRRLYGQVSHALLVICHIIRHTQLFVSSELPEGELKQDEEDEQAKEKDSWVISFSVWCVGMYICTCCIVGWSCVSSFILGAVWWNRRLTGLKKLQQNSPEDYRIGRLQLRRLKGVWTIDRKAFEETSETGIEYM